MPFDTPFDTIAAISSPPGEGGIGIVRISGKNAFSIVQNIFHPRRRKDFSGGFKSFTMHLGYIKDGERTIDEVLVSFMKAPHTYTREDVAEINCHGGAVAVNEVLRCVLASGARLAEPGEFTKRAFINGRIDLAQAEAVLDIVRAKTGKSLEAALNQLKGDLSAAIEGLVKGLKDVLIALEASIDFAGEEGVSEVSAGELCSRLTAVQKELDLLIESYDTGRIFRDGVLTALVGKPNVGKSSLLNAFLKFDRAIVTPIPGTTRDVIEEQLNIGGIPFILADTAGITASDNLIEKEGIRRSRSYLEKADLVLVIFDGANPLDERDLEIARNAREKSCIPVINKIDLPLRFEKNLLARETGLGSDFIHLSAKDGTGLKELEKRMTETAVQGTVGGSYATMVTNTRHYASLVKARAELAHALETLLNPGVFNTPEPGSSLPAPELVAYDVRSALDFLGEITGEVTKAEILDAIFSTFCIGK